MFKIPVETTIIIVIGNGFDLSLGLPTGYPHFIKSSQFEKLLSDGNEIAHKLYNKHSLQNWIDIENELKRISINAVERTNYEPSYDDLCLTLIDYLKNIDYSEINMDSNAITFLTHLIRHRFFILDYNYTKSTEIILSKIGLTNSEIVQSHIKVHGSVEDNKIVFGVEDHAKIRKRDIFLKKSFNRIFKAVNLQDIMNPKRELHIFGHSLGETDHTYFMPFFKERVRKPFPDKSKIVLHHFGKDGYRDLMSEIDILTGHQIAIFKRFNDFELLDCSK